MSDKTKKYIENLQRENIVLKNQIKDLSNSILLHLHKAPPSEGVNRLLVMAGAFSSDYYKELTKNV